MNPGYVHTMGAVAAVMLCAACATPSAPPTLEGTRWHLVSITSMDDRQGVYPIAELGRFTLQLGADGMAVLRLDCNRGSTTWKAQAAGDGVTGTVQFGPVASTRALCPSPHLDERVARELPWVRGYRIQNGRLYLSLMADGGIYEWLPAPASE